MSWSLFLQLMRKDLLQFRRVYAGKFFDTCFLFFTNVIVFAYFLPQFIAFSDYGPFILIGAIASFGLFDIIAQVSELIFDVEGDRAINFTLAMPAPSWVVFGQIALKWAANNFLLCIPLFLVGKLILWAQFDLWKINIPKLLLIYVTSCLFFGFFSLWLTSILRKVKSLSSLFLRFINPLFMFGGFFFTWQSTFELSPILGYVILINPMIYVMEGMRAAALGQEGYLPFWICVIVLWGFILTLGACALNILKKRLDCV